jgi:hypothetical protein
MDPFYLTVVGLVLVASFLIVPLYTCSRRASVELNLKPYWQERCTGKIGALGIGIPAIRVALYQDFMVIGFLWQTIIPYRDIVGVSVKRGFSFFGVSGVALKLRGIRSGYHFNSRDPQSLANMIESHLTDHSTGTR